MSLLPYLLHAYERPQPLSLLGDQHFGLAFTPDDVLMTVAHPHPPRELLRPLRHLRQMANDAGSTIKSDKDKFQVNLDVQHFAPEEISVKTVDGYVVVEGAHEEKQDEHGYISRKFSRRYALPEGCVPDAVESRLSSDGVLTVTAPRKVPPAVKGERHIPVTHTGPVRKQIGETPPQQNKQ